MFAWNSNGVAIPDIIRVKASMGGALSLEGTGLVNGVHFEWLAYLTGTTGWEVQVTIHNRTETFSGGTFNCLLEVSAGARRHVLARIPEARS